jgi:uncharacterized protein YqeY
MATLAKKISEDLKKAIKTKDVICTSTLRMVTASMENLSIEKKVKELEDADVIKIISKQVRQHEDSIESFKKGKRDDLVEKETKEFEILKSYLPKQPDEKQIEELVKKIISQAGVSSRADFGNVMKLVMQELKNQADGKIVSAIVQKLLS